MPQLAKALRDGDDVVRSPALEVLGQIGPGAAETVPALKELFDDKQEWLRSQAGEALKGINGQ